MKLTHMFLYNMVHMLCKVSYHDTIHHSLTHPPMWLPESLNLKHLEESPKKEKS